MTERQANFVQKFFRKQPGEHALTGPHKLRDSSPAGLLFDMGGVLYDATAWRRWLLQLLARIGLQTHYQAFFRIWEREFLREVYIGQRDYWDAFRAFLQSMGLSPAQIDEVAAASHARQREQEHHVRPLPGVAPTLARLYAAGMPMGVLSNSHHTGAELWKKLDHMGLGGIFQWVLSSRELGHAKPSVHCYQNALASTGLAACGVVFIGHDPDELAGAAAAGMHTVAFNYDSHASADVCIDRFEQLMDVLPCWQARALAG